MVIRAHIHSSIIHKVYVDTGISTNIIYEHCFIQFPQEWKTRLRPTAGRLKGFTGHSIRSLGTIQLPLSIYSQDNRRKETVLIEFVVVHHPEEHNIIIGRTNVLCFGAIASTNTRARLVQHTIRTRNHDGRNSFKAPMLPNHGSTEIAREEKQNRDVTPKEKRSDQRQFSKAANTSRHRASPQK